MKVGDLVKFIHGIRPTTDSVIDQYRTNREPHKGSFGIIVDIDPLRRGLDCHFAATNEIVVMLDSGELWYASPDAWSMTND